MERKQLQSAAPTYTYLRGLLTVPVGALIVVGGLSNLQLGPFRYLWVVPALCVVVAALYWRTDKYYKEHFGRVTPTRAAKIRVGIATVLGMVGVIAASQGDWSLDLPVCLTAAVFSVFMLGFGATTVGLRSHHYVIWGGLLVAALVPLWGDVSPDHKINVGLILVGIATMISGWFDHVALVRSFGPPSANDLQDSGVRG